MTRDWSALSAVSKRDFFFDWFSELDALGEHTSFRLGRCTNRESQPEWFVLPHHTYDGLGGLCHVLRERYATELCLPQLAGRYPSRSQRWLAAMRCIFRRKPGLLRWRGSDIRAETSGHASLSGGPTAFAWRLLSEHETLALRRRAREQNLSLNAWLLWGLTRAMLPHWVPHTGLVEWVVPVNMRGATPGLRPTANQAATIDVVFRPDAAPREIDTKLRTQLQAHAHWGVWQLLQWLEGADPALVRRLARHEASVEKHGSFSNLGSLRGALSPLSTQAATAAWWMAFNPVLRRRPVGAACLTWNDRLAVTLQLHPTLSTDPLTAERCIASWMDALGA